MDERAIVAERLRKKTLEVHALEEKLRTARIYLQALQDVMKALGGQSDEARGESILRSGSAVSQARDVILKASKPVHISDLLRALGRDDTRDVRASLTSSLAAYVRRGEVFTRPAPNTYGLVELGHETVEDAEPAPPAGFGQASLIDLDDDNPF